MGFLGFLGTFVAGGVAGYFSKDVISGNASKNDSKQKELDSIYAENEKFSRRNKELERQVEDLMSELNKLRKQAKEHDEDNDDLEDELDKTKRELKNFKLQYDELARKVKEYKTTCEAQEAEIALLKEKLG